MSNIVRWDDTNIVFGVKYGIIFKWQLLVVRLPQLCLIYYNSIIAQ